MTIIVGIDGSETSLRAGAYAVGLARRQGSRLIAVYVRTPYRGMVSFADAYGAAAASTAEAQSEMEAEFRDTLQREGPRLGCAAEMLVRHGDPFTELCQAATETWADLVVVGRSRSPLHRIAGSVAQRLVRCGRWPVTVVP